MKHCSKCSLVKWNNEFYKDASHKDGLRSNCKQCQNSQRREWYKENIGRLREQELTWYHKNKTRATNATYKSRYGITLEQKMAMFALQEGRCLGCEEEFTSSKDTQIDHDHETGKVRGLLCKSCNWALGHVKDNPNILLNLANYLVKNLTRKEGKINVQSESQRYSVRQSS